MQGKFVGIINEAYIQACIQIYLYVHIHIHIHIHIHMYIHIHIHICIYIHIYIYTYIYTYVYHLICQLNNALDTCATYLGTHGKHTCSVELFLGLLCMHLYVSQYVGNCMCMYTYRYVSVFCMLVCVYIKCFAFKLAGKKTKRNQCPVR